MQAGEHAPEKQGRACSGDCEIREDEQVHLLINLRARAQKQQVVQRVDQFASDGGEVAHSALYGRVV